MFHGVCAFLSKPKPVNNSKTKQQKNISLSRFCKWNLDYHSRETLFRCLMLLSFRIDLIKVIKCIVISKVKPKVKRQEARKKEEHNVLEWMIEISNVNRHSSVLITGSWIPQLMCVLAGAQDCPALTMPSVFLDSRGQHFGTVFMPYL